MLHVLVCGGRNDLNREKVYSVLDKIHKEKTISCIIQGGASGADYISKMWAKRNSVKVKEYRANWNEHGKAAGAIRNKVMLEDSEPHFIIAFPGGNGTAHMIKIARQQSYTVFQIN